MEGQRPKIVGVYRFEFTVEADYYAVEEIVRDVNARLRALDSRLAYKWDKLENGKPVYHDWPDGDG